MTRSRLGVLGVALFVFGLFVLVLGLFLLLPYGREGSSVALFTTVSAVALYGVVFAPLLAPDAIGRLTGGRIVSLGMAMRGVSLYAALTITDIVLANTMYPPPLKFLVVAQLVGTFVLLMWCFLGRAAEEHIEDVRREEAATRGSIDRLRATSEQLALRASRLDTSSEANAKLVGYVDRIAEELRYTSPVHTAEAARLEERIAQGLDGLVATLSRTPDLGVAQAQVACDEADEVLMLIAQRRSLRS